MNDLLISKAKRLDTGEWVYGYYCPCVLGKWPLRPCIVPEIDGLWRPIEIDMATLCRCTGLHDRNNKLIYENDIVVAVDKYTSEARKGKVVWDEFQWFIAGDYAEYTKNHCEITVVGTIHDTPELLKEG